MTISGMGDTVMQISPTPMPPVYLPDTGGGPTVYHPTNTGSDTGSVVTIVSEAASSPGMFGLSASTLLLIGGGLILMFAMKK